MRGTGGRKGIPAWPVYVAAVGALAALPLLSRIAGEPLSLFTRDVFSIAEIPVYAGLYSNVGIALWAATCAICLYTAWLVRESSGWRGDRGVLAAFGALSGVLMVDDFLLVHEWIAPEFLHVPEQVVYASYGVALAALLVAFRRRLLERGVGQLGAALVFFAASLAMDVTERPPAPAWRYLGEEGLKFLGIVAWTLYFVRFAARSAREGLTGSRPT